MKLLFRNFTNSINYVHQHSFFKYLLCTRINFSIGTNVFRASFSNEHVKRNRPMIDPHRFQTARESTEIFSDRTWKILKILSAGLVIFTGYRYFFSYYYDLEHEEEMLKKVPGYMGYMLKVDPLYEQRINKLRKKKAKFNDLFGWD